MKRFVAVLSGLLVLPAFAEVAPLYYDEIIEYFEEDAVAGDVVADEEVTPVAPIVQSPAVNPRGASTRSVTRSVPATSNTNTRSAGNRAVASTRNAARVASRTTTTGVKDRASTRVVSRTNRSAQNGKNQIVTTRRAMQSPSSATARVSVLSGGSSPLYVSNGNRVSSRASAIKARIPTISLAADAGTATATDVAGTVASMDELAQMTDYCKAQYTQCMDNFCNVLDDNQGRCSCSKNIKNYEKTEQALKDATIALQEVAQQIQYIGLTGDEVETLFKQTEAELSMQGASDNSHMKNNLDKIKDMIVDVKSGTVSSTDSGMGFDLSGLLDFNIDSTGFDLTSMFSNTTTGTNSISNQRGEQLYKTATARCKATVLTDCQAQGVDISVITNSYDLEIDKQCIAYERALTNSNDEMDQTVRNAKSVLQRARLMVAQQKNAYDLRGCISALDACMQDDFVCGSDYELCLDPTGKYIVDGEIVVGSTPGYVVEGASSVSPSQEYANNTLMSSWYYDTGKFAWGATTDDGTLADYIKSSISSTPVSALTGDANMAQYLQYKIGYNEGGKNYGMCMSVLNKCQDITYDAGVYNPKNQVVTEYLSRVLVQIKNAQDAIIADHAENCIMDVSSCLASNGYDSGVSTTKQNIAINACRYQVKTCMSVNGNTANNPTPEDLKNWVDAMFTEE